MPLAAILPLIGTIAPSLIGKLVPGAGGASGAPGTSVNIKQDVTQTQSTNIGSPSYSVDPQLAALLGPSDGSVYPPTLNIDQQMKNMNDLYQNALGVSVPGSASKAAYPTTNYNQLLWVVAGVMIVVIVVKKLRRK